MPYKTFTKLIKGQKKYCMTSLSSGRTYCYKSKADREEGKRMHKMFKHMKTNKK